MLKPDIAQQLGAAYETLKDQGRRRAYDLIHPSITRNRSSPQSTQTHRPSPASTPQSGAVSETAQIAALQKSIQEREARWQTKRCVFDSSIFEIRRDIRRLEQEIQNLNSIAAAEVAEEAQKNSWGTWLLSPIYKKAAESEEEKSRKGRQKQERRIEKDMKERRLVLKDAEYRKQESLFREAQREADAANLVDAGKIRALQAKIQARASLERQERERVEREQMARIWKQQQEQQDKWEREAADALRRRRAEEQAAWQKRQEEQAREWQTAFDDGYQASEILCGHDGWWSKVQGRTACPECDVIWTYLLQCPGCNMKACPKCQYTIRPRRNGNRARETQSWDFSYDSSW